MPLTINNNLPSSNICFGSTHNHSEISLTSNIDSYTSLNVCNIIIHHCVIITHPEIVSRYIQYDNKNPFGTIERNYTAEDY